MMQGREKQRAAFKGKIEADAVKGIGAALNGNTLEAGDAITIQSDTSIAKKISEKAKNRPKGPMELE